MPPGAPRSLDGRCYRLALSLCPPGFRREHGEEMTRDFDEARGEAAARGRNALWMLRFAMAIDLVRTVSVQWLHTGFPIIAFVSILISLAIAEMLAAVARRATVRMPDEVADAEVIGVLLLGVTSVVLIAMTITLTLWVNRPRRRGRR